MAKNKLPNMGNPEDWIKTPSPMHPGAFIYTNPVTGVRMVPTGISRPETPTTTTPTTKTMTKEEQAAYAAEHYPTANLAMTPGYNPAAPGTWAEHLALLEEAGYPTTGLTEPAVAPTEPTVTPSPTAPTLTMPPPPTPPTMPEVPTVPPYEPSPEQVAWQKEYGEDLREWREEGGYGIPEETQAQMIQRTTDTLKSREQEALRVMRNNMERRGITNSGFVFANEQNIRSATSVAIANNIRDVQIESSLMKLASFEKAMGATAQFIGYLAEESWKAYQPKVAQVELEARYALTEYGVKAEYGLAGYQAQVQGILNQWQAEFDLMKMELNQAYAQDNIELQAQLQGELNQAQYDHELELIEMEIEASQQASLWQGIGSIVTLLLGFLFL